MGEVQRLVESLVAMNEILRDRERGLAAARDDARPDGGRGGDADLHLPEPVRLSDRRGGGQPGLPRGARRDVLRRLARAAAARARARGVGLRPRARAARALLRRRGRRRGDARPPGRRACSATATRPRCCTPRWRRTSGSTDGRGEVRLDLPFAEQGRHLAQEDRPRAGRARRRAEAHDHAAGRARGDVRPPAPRSRPARWWCALAEPEQDPLASVREHLDEAHAAADRLVREAQRQAEASSAAGGEESRRAAGEPRRPQPLPLPDLQRARRRCSMRSRSAVPPELSRQLAEALRELLVALRALIDWYLAAARRARRAATPAPRSRTSRWTDHGAT